MGMITYLAQLVECKKGSVNAFPRQSMKSELHNPHSQAQASALFLCAFASRFHTLLIGFNFETMHLQSHLTVTLAERAIPFESG